NVAVHTYIRTFAKAKGKREAKPWLDLRSRNDSCGDSRPRLSSRRSRDGSCETDTPSRHHHSCRSDRTSTGDSGHRAAALAKLKISLGSDPEKENQSWQA